MSKAPPRIVVRRSLRESYVPWGRLSDAQKRVVRAVYGLEEEALARRLYWITDKRKVARPSTPRQADSYRGARKAAAWQAHLAQKAARKAAGARA